MILLHIEGYGTERGGGPFGITTKIKDNVNYNNASQYFNFYSLNNLFIFYEFILFFHQQNIGFNSKCLELIHGLSGNNYRVSVLSKSYSYRNHHAKFEIDKTIL